MNRMMYGQSSDTYWKISDSKSKADFLRIRMRDRDIEMTIKGKDKGTNTDRLEIDLLCTGSYKDTHKFASALYGESIGSITKNYYVFFLNFTDTISCYELTQPEYGKIFVEVEASSKNKMLELEAQVREAFVREGLRIEQAPGSLYEMFLVNEHGGSNVFSQPNSDPKL